MLKHPQPPLTLGYSKLHFVLEFAIRMADFTIKIIAIYIIKSPATAIFTPLNAHLLFADNTPMYSCKNAGRNRY